MDEMTAKYAADKWDITPLQVQLLDTKELYGTSAEV